MSKRVYKVYDYGKNLPAVSLLTSLRVACYTVSDVISDDMLNTLQRIIDPGSRKRSYINNISTLLTQCIRELIKNTSKRGKTVLSFPNDYRSEQKRQNTFVPTRLIK